jgi:methyl-accepting chemotaxis protein
MAARGNPTERADVPRPGEIAAVEDALDELNAWIEENASSQVAATALRDRLAAVADELDAAARGDLTVRIATSGDPSEDTLGAAINRLLEAMERQVVRLRSHLDAIAKGGAPASVIDDDDDGATPAERVRKRVQGLKPVPPLLNDISQRLGNLARLVQSPERVPRDLKRLSEGVGQRAKAAQMLFDSLEADLAALPAGEGPDAGLTPAQERALSALREDLSALRADSALPTLLESLRDLDDREIARRVATGRPSA